MRGWSTERGGWNKHPWGQQDRASELPPWQEQHGTPKGHRVWGNMTATPGYFLLSSLPVCQSAPTWMEPRGLQAPCPLVPLGVGVLQCGAQFTENGDTSRRCSGSLHRDTANTRMH